MTKKEIKKFNIIQSCIDGVYTVPEAASKLGLSDRQVQRLKKEVKLNGVNGVIHKSRGRKATNAIPDSLEDKIVEFDPSFETGIPLSFSLSKRRAVYGNVPFSDDNEPEFLYNEIV